MFAGCSSLGNVTIPASVKTIGKNAFYRCTGLTDVMIAEGVEKIGNWAFGDCSHLANITIPASVSEIGDETFLAYFEPDIVTIHVPAGSCAERYAEENNFPFAAV